MRVLVTGGAGYVGSNVVRALLEADHRVVVLDDLSSGHRAAVPEEVPLVVGTCGDPEALDEVAADGALDGVMHMAARTSVSESVQDPGLYYDVNVAQSLRLLDWMAARGVDWIIHSSTCAVYGIPETDAIDEAVCPRPINAYGATKLSVDRAVRFYEGAGELRGSSLRYFNAAGAAPDGSLGEDKTPASNLIPRVLGVALGRYPEVTVHGDDYEGSPDGTGVRDYVHVSDLADAHLRAMDALAAGRAGDVYNLGTETGSSVAEVIETARRVTGDPIPSRTGPRRPGDPGVLVAASGKARRELGWRPARSDLESVLEDAWRWHRRHPDGYPE